MRVAIPSSIKKDLSTLNRQSRKRLLRVAKLYIAPEQAKIGPALAQIGINSMEFCERFNAQTRGFDKELLLSVKIYVFSDKSFTFQIKPIQLKDLVVSFGLDESWNLNYLSGAKALSLGSFQINDVFFLAFFKSFLVYQQALTGDIKGLNVEGFIKTLLAYLKSWKI